MDTILNVKQESERRRRRHYLPEFKAKLIALCKEPGVPIAFVGRKYGVNDNLIHRWMKEPKHSSGLGSQIVDSSTQTAEHSFVELPFRSPIDTAESSGQIEFDLQRGELKLKVKWPTSNALECVHIIKALFK